MVSATWRRHADVWLLPSETSSSYSTRLSDVYDADSSRPLRYLASSCDRHTCTRLHCTQCSLDLVVFMPFSSRRSLRFGQPDNGYTCGEAQRVLLRCSVTATSSGRLHQVKLMYLLNTILPKPASRGRKSNLIVILLGIKAASTSLPNAPLKRRQPQYLHSFRPAPALPSFRRPSCELPCR